MDQQDDDYEAILRARAAERPEEWLRPITTAEAAEALGLGTPEALQKMRSRNKQLGLPVPPGFASMPGLGWRYRSKLDLLIWAHEFHRERSLDPGVEDAA